ncbi:hypothetical protein DPMN_044399 [Dreissena polymorpha]|uniref:Uncharacterized protein n=1 Tax=Dreissena polymorpha TaxID=45954 RepID=A0A9D4D433_DREPO|nr:hypothetical protein DPMN_044399 [Dreissena polymorpha]
MNPMSNHSVVHKNHTNGSSCLYLKNDVQEQINPADKSKEHDQESNNLSKMESGLEASLDVKVNFETKDSIPESLSNKINDTGSNNDVQTVEVQNENRNRRTVQKMDPLARTTS